MCFVDFDTHTRPGPSNVEVLRGSLCITWKKSVCDGFCLFLSFDLETLYLGSLGVGIAGSRALIPFVKNTRLMV